MADGRPDDGPRLEMPSFSLRRRKQAAGGAAESPEPVAETQTVVEPEPGHVEPQRERERVPPAIGGLPAAALTGLLVGALAVLIAWVAGAGCSAVRGTSSCGGAAGLPILLAALVVLASAGAMLLRMLGVGEAGSTSLLAVGVLAVLVMVLLLGSLDEWWAILAVPATSLVAYLGSWWVTAVVAGEDEPAGARTPYDVR